MITPEMVSGEMVLYFGNLRECEKSPAFIILDCENERLYVEKRNLRLWEENPEDYIAHKCFWQVSGELEVGAVNRILRKISPLAPRIVDGWKQVRDGDRLVDAYDEDAIEAMAKIDHLIDTLASYGCYA